MLTKNDSGKLVRGQSAVEGLRPLWIRTAGTAYLASAKSVTSKLYDLGRSRRHTTKPVPRLQLASFCEFLEAHKFTEWQPGRHLEEALHGKDELLQKGFERVADWLQDTVLYTGY